MSNDGYADERRRLLVERVRWAGILGVIPIALAIPVNFAVYPQSFAPRAALLALLAAVCAAGALATRFEVAVRRADVLAVAFVLAVAAGAGILIRQSPEDLDVLVGVVAAIMMSAALVFPWGVGAQAMVSLTMAVGYVVLAPWSFWDAGRITNVLMVLGDGTVLSVAGAWLLDQQRRATWVEREQAARLARQRERLVDDLQRADRIKSEFVSTMSHELRTPLGVIMGFTEMLEERDPAALALAIARIKAASRELLELIEETLDLNRLESGRDVPRPEPLALPVLWAELAAEFEALPRSPTVALRWEPAPDGTLHSDRRKVRMIVKNLVGNALKFTPVGEVVVSCTTDGDRCLLAVTDTGVGIAPDDLPLIFEMFRQVDSSDRRSYGGVGLGLHIVQRLAAQLGGQVAVESTPGAGSQFRVSLPGWQEAAAPTVRRSLRGAV